MWHSENRGRNKTFEAGLKKKLDLFLFIFDVRFGTGKINQGLVALLQTEI